MTQQIINAIVPVLVTAIIAVLTAVIKLVSDAAIEFIEKQKEALVIRTGVEKYNAELTVAREVWGIVDEYFRITPNVTKTMETAQERFTQELLKRIPGLTADEIEHLRQAVAGEVNKGREVITSPAPAGIKRLG